MRAIAEGDLSFILEDGIYGFGWPITLTSPAGAQQILTGFSNDISQIIDPDTGQAVSGRVASIAIRISSLTELPVGIADSVSKPWLATFDDINGNSFTFKIAQSNPDRALGVLTCILELYR